MYKVVIDVTITDIVQTTIPLRLSGEWTIDLIEDQTNTVHVRLHSIRVARIKICGRPKMDE